MELLLHCNNVVMPYNSYPLKVCTRIKQINRFKTLGSVAGTEQEPSVAWSSRIRLIWPSPPRQPFLSWLEELRAPLMPLSVWGRFPSPRGGGMPRSRSLAMAQAQTGQRGPGYSHLAGSIAPARSQPRPLGGQLNTNEPRATGPN